MAKEQDPYTRDDRFGWGWKALDALGVGMAPNAAGIFEPMYCCPVCRRGFFRRQLVKHDKDREWLTEEHAPAGVGHPRLLTCRECNHCANEMFEDQQDKVQRALRKIDERGGTARLPYTVEGATKFITSCRSPDGDLVPTEAEVARLDGAVAQLETEPIRDRNYRRALKDSFHIATATLGYSFALCGRLSQLAESIGCAHGDTPGFPSVKWSALNEQYPEKVLVVIDPIIAVIVSGLPGDHATVLPCHRSPAAFGTHAHELLRAQRLAFAEVHNWSDTMEMRWDHRPSPFRCPDVPKATTMTEEQRHAYNEAQIASMKRFRQS